MAVLMADRVKETSTTTGTGTYSLAGTSTGFRTFVAGIGNGNQCYYCAEDGTNWEVGVGTITSGTPATLARTTVMASSNGGAAVNWGAGTRNIFCTFPATGIMFTANNGSDIADKNIFKQNIFLLPTGQSGGTDGKVVRMTTTANTWTDASQADTIDQLVGLRFKAGGYYYPPGTLITGLSGLTVGLVYYLTLAASSPNFISSAFAPTPSSTVRRVVIGKAVSTTSLDFYPLTPIGG